MAVDGNGKLTLGTKIQTIMGSEIVVVQWLAEGGQGDVYIIRYNGEKKALKWYKPQGMGKNPKAFYDNIKNNVVNGSPSDEFLWPLDITLWVDGVFGYVMDLRPKEYYELSEFMLTNVRFASYRRAIDAALHIVSAYRILHNKGYSYQDLNDGNFFINPKNGKVLICDNDNVAPDKTETGILGKPRYMAPEVVTGKTMPNNLSDRFSMSIILFIIFTFNHPLEGKRSMTPCLTPQLQEKLYGTDPIFIMDPQNKENGPDPEVHKNVIRVWKYLPEYMQKLFLQAFSKEAFERPNVRPREKEWLDALVRFRSEIVPCRCGNEIFTQEGANKKCESCGRKTNILFRLKFRDYSIPGIPDSRIYRCQLGVCKENEALDPIARVVANKADPKKLGIRNESDKIWNAVTSSGKARKVQPKELIPLKDGIKFEVHNETIEIKQN